LNLNILVLPGDGIGTEVTREAVRVLRHVADKFKHSVKLTEGLLGGIAIHKTGTPFPPQTEALSQEADATLLGAVGLPDAGINLNERRMTGFRWYVAPLGGSGEIQSLGSRVALRAGKPGLFAVVTLVNMNPSLLAFSGYPPLQDIVSSVALTFFAFLGFGIITFTAKDLANPARQLPRAMFLALGIATVIYVAIALGVFGTLTVDEVIASGGTALAVAAKPTLGQAGYWLMAITALFATAGATNAGLYPAAGLSDRLAETGQFPPLMAKRVRGRASMGLLVQAVACALLALFFNLDAIASIGSAVALLIFTFITAAHFRVRSETRANAAILAVAIASSAVVLVTFIFTTLIHEPASVATLLAILVLSIALDLGWKRSRAGRTPSEPPSGRLIEET